MKTPLKNSHILFSADCTATIMSSVHLWCCALWLNDAEQVPSRKTILRLSTPYMDCIHSKLLTPKFYFYYRSLFWSRDYFVYIATNMPAFCYRGGDQLDHW